MSQGISITGISIAGISIAEAALGQTALDRIPATQYQQQKRTAPRDLKITGRCAFSYLPVMTAINHPAQGRLRKGTLSTPSARRFCQSVKLDSPRLSLIRSPPSSRLLIHNALPLKL